MSKMDKQNDRSFLVKSIIIFIIPNFIMLKLAKTKKVYQGNPTYVCTSTYV